MKALFCLACGLMAMSMAPQGPPSALFRTQVNGVRLNVSVSQSGRPVSGLTAADFEVTDAGISQSISELRALGHLNVSLALDVSPSIDRALDLPALVAAARAVADALAPDDTCALLQFSDRIHLETPSTPSRTELRRAIDAVATHPPPARIAGSMRGTSAVWDAAFAAASLVAEGTGQPLVVLLSDGADNASWLIEFGPSDARARNHQREKTFESLRRGGIPIDIIWTPRRYRTDVVFGALDPAEAAKHTDGTSYFAQDRQLSSKLRERFAALRAGYVLTYIPVGVPSDDGWHAIKVKLKTQKGRVETSAGYYAGAIGKR